MGHADSADEARVRSGDGTEIACRVGGDGPPLVLVHGTPADHTRWGPLLVYLQPPATVWAMDRRGRGASGDGPDYRLFREFEDVAAVVDAAAELIFRELLRVSDDQLAALRAQPTWPGAGRGRAHGRA